jgi:CheY-like chemotaxis protein
VSPGSRIFVVDDEPVIASSLAAILRMNGFSARFFTSPLEALAAARSESPDLVISDATAEITDRRTALPDLSKRAFVSSPSIQGKHIPKVDAPLQTAIG